MYIFTCLLQKFSLPHVDLEQRGWHWSSSLLPTPQLSLIIEQYRERGEIITLFVSRNCQYNKVFCPSIDWDFPSNISILCWILIKSKSYVNVEDQSESLFFIDPCVPLLPVGFFWRRELNLQCAVVMLRSRTLIVSEQWV